MIGVTMTRYHNYIVIWPIYMYLKFIFNSYILWGVVLKSQDKIFSKKKNEKKRRESQHNSKLITDMINIFSLLFRRMVEMARLYTIRHVKLFISLEEFIEEKSSLILIWRYDMILSATIIVHHWQKWGISALRKYRKITRETVKFI